MEIPVRIVGHNIDLTETLKDYVNAKISKLKNHFANIIDVHVSLSLERINHKMQHKAKACVIVPKKHRIIAEEISEDMYASIDLLLDSLDRQIIEFKREMKEE